MTTALKYRQLPILVLLSLTALFTEKVIAEELPVRLQVALLSKIVAMEHNLATKPKITIYVLGAPKIYELLKNDVGFKIGNSTLSIVDYGKDLPQQKYDVIYIGAHAQVDAAVEYAKRHSAMSLYPKISGKKQQGSLGLGIKSGKPTFYLDLEQSEAEKLHWNAKIIKLAQLR